VPALIRSHDLLEHLWLGLWEKRSAASLEDAVGEVIDELRADIAALQEIGDGAGGYGDAVEALGAFRPEQRGSGTKTAVLSAVAAWLFADQPERAVITCANRLGTDTDSIATMTGALIGATLDEGPHLPLTDRSYIEREADRMWAISEQRQVSSFPYPAIMTWSPPRSQLDCRGLAGERLAAAGLGPASEQGEILAESGKADGAWGWADLWFGQRVLIKRRTRPKPLPESQIVSPDQRYVTASLLDAPPRSSRDRGQEAAARPGLARRPPQGDGESDESRRKPRTLHRITDEVIATGFDPAAVGRGLLELADREDGIELAGQYASIVAKARLSRRDRDRRE
jgi:hypothetical protein